MIALFCNVNFNVKSNYYFFLIRFFSASITNPYPIIVIILKIYHRQGVELIISQQALELLKAFKIGFNPINKLISSKLTKFKIIPIIQTMANQNVKDFIIFFIRSHSLYKTQYKTQFTATMIILYIDD